MFSLDGMEAKYTLYTACKRSAFFTGVPSDTGLSILEISATAKDAQEFMIIDPSHAAAHRMSLVIALLGALFGCAQETGVSDIAVSSHCKEIPRPANAKLPLATASDAWYQVYKTAPDTYAIVEPYHYQETISHLIIGAERALLFDTGSGFQPIRPVVERITSLPVTVLNSHTHYDHVGSNAEFSSILAIDTEYTRANMAGFSHDRIASETDPATFCPELPKDADPETFFTRAWKATGFVTDGELLDLGNRTLQVLHVPGHTPDALALLDADNGLLFTGDSYYDAPIWLFVPETSLDAYASSISRLVRAESEVRYLLGAHNAARVDAGALARVESAFGKLASGNSVPVTEEDGILSFDIDGVEFVTAEQVLQRRPADPGKGGSGLDGW